MKWDENPNKYKIIYRHSWLRFKGCLRFKLTEVKGVI